MEAPMATTMATTMARGRVLPPSANWFCSKVCAWGWHASVGVVVVFGAKSSVVIYRVLRDVHDGDDVALEFHSQITRARNDQRVTSVECIVDGDDGRLLVACGGEEGAVQLWDVLSGKKVDQHRKHGNVEVTALAVNSAHAAHLVVTGDRNGKITTWQRDLKTLSVCTPVSNDGVTALAIAPNGSTTVAVGFRSGILCLVDFITGTVTHRLDGHDQEVQGLAWKSVPISEPPSQLVLASSSRDKTIKLWGVITDLSDSELLQSMALPKTKQEASFNQTKRLWLPIAWSSVHDGCLWSGSVDGSLYLWDGQTSRGATRNIRPLMTKAAHSRLIFSIDTMPATFSAAGQVTELMITVSLDRELRVWRETSDKNRLMCKANILGLGGHAYNVDFAETTKSLAVGVGDQTIRLWDMGAKALFKQELLWKGLQSKITSVAWHPFQQGLLAYGGEDGRIGIYDVQTKKNTRFRTSHSSQVTQIQWRICHQKPPKVDEDESSKQSAMLNALRALEQAQEAGQSLEDALAAQEATRKHTSTATAETSVLLWTRDFGGCIFESRPTHPEKPSRQVAEKCTSFSWTSTGNCVAIGRQDGTVVVLRDAVDGEDSGSGFEGLAMVSTSHGRLEKVTALSWAGDGVSLATGYQDGQVLTSQYVDGSSASSALLSGHSGFISCLRWSQSEAGGVMLVSASTDGVVRVWDTKRQSSIAEFRGHCGRVLSAVWLEGGLIASAGEDQTVRVWRPDDHPPSSSPTGKQTQKSPASAKQKQKNPDEALPTAQYIDTAVTSADDQGKLQKKTKKKKKSSWFHDDLRLADKDCIDVCLDLSSRKHPSSHTNKCWAFDRSYKSVTGFLTGEAKRFEQEKDWRGMAQMHVVQGNVSEALRIVTDAGELDPSWIALAPSIGIDAWRDVTRSYAEQLETAGEKSAAAQQYLVLGNVRAAIRCLRDCNSYLEALALARARLVSSDPIIQGILLEYSEYLESQKRFGEAAVSFLSIDESYSDQTKTRAIRALLKIRDESAVLAAFEVIRPNPRSPDTTEAHAIPDGIFVHILSAAISTGNFTAVRQVLQSVSPDHLQVSSIELAAGLCVANIMEFFQGRVQNVEPGDIETTEAGCAAHKFLASLNSASPTEKAELDVLWKFVFQICRDNGLWFEGADEKLEEVQDFLGNRKSLVFLTKTQANSPHASFVEALVQVCHLLLQVAVELMHGYLLSALECLEQAASEAVASFKSGAEGTFDLGAQFLFLVFPTHLLSFPAFPLFGELADEGEDTKTLFQLLILHQYRMIVHVLETQGDSSNQVKATPHQLVAALRDEFFSQPIPDDERTIQTLKELLLDLKALMTGSDNKICSSTIPDDDVEGAQKVMDDMLECLVQS